MDAPDLLAHVHRRLLVMLSGELRMPIQGLSQAARLLQHRLSSSSRRRLRELDAAFGIVRHITEERNSFFIDKITAELRRSSLCSTTALASASSPTGPIMYDIGSCTDDLSVVFSAPSSPRPGSSSLCSRASTDCDAHADITTTVLDPRTVVGSSQDVASQASVSQVSSHVQTTLDGDNRVILSDPHTLVQVAVNNSCAILAHDLQPCITVLHDIFAQVCDEHVDARDGGSIALPADTPLVEVAIDRPLIDTCGADYCDLWCTGIASSPSSRRPMCRLGATLTSSWTLSCRPWMNCLISWCIPVRSGSSPASSWSTGSLFRFAWDLVTGSSSWQSHLPFRTSGTSRLAMTRYTFRRTSSRAIACLTIEGVASPVASAACELAYITLRPSSRVASSFSGTKLRKYLFAVFPEDFLFFPTLRVYN